MANQKHVRILQEGAIIWNKWRKQHPDIKPNLKDIDIGIDGENLSLEMLKRVGRREELIQAIKFSREGLKGINLSGTDLSDANLWRINLSYADLSGANLQGAYLRDTNFYRANLKRANLGECLLRSTILNAACLDETDFSASEISLTRFQNVDLSTAKGFDTCYRLHPRIDVTTILLSRGAISEAFLRNAHVPEPLISYSKSLYRTIVLHGGKKSDVSILKPEPIKIFRAVQLQAPSFKQQGFVQQHQTGSG